MGQRVPPALDVNCQRGVVLPMKAAPVRQDGIGYVLVAQRYHVGIERATKDPGLGVCRTATFEDPVVEEHTTRTKTLIAWEQAAETFQRRGRRIEKASGSQERKHFDAREFLRKLGSRAGKILGSDICRDTNDSRIAGVRRKSFRI